MDPTPADPLVGKAVAQYEILAKLGGGGMGVVYAARDTKLGRRVALKFLPPQWSHDESAKQRFIREAQAASATDHPNICTVHDIQTAPDGQLFIVMAHYDGQTLKQRLERGEALAVEEAIDIAAQVAEGLAKAHAQGVIHRDIKPGNLMLTEDGVKILDFGLAKFADARLKLTLEGSTLGTIAYMSPEQARGEEADARSDIWATGVVLYEMVAGDVPFKGAYAEAVSHAIKTEPPQPLRTVRHDIPEALERLVFRALHKHPDVRLQSARELARALRLLQGRTMPLDLRTEPLPPVLAAHAPVTSRRDRGQRRAAGAAAVVGIVLVAASVWLLSPVARVPVAVAPVVNQTGYAELDPYRLALTHELVTELADSRRIRILPYERLLQIVRRFRDGAGDVSSREAMQALATQSGANVIIVPTLLYENGAWRARVEFRDAGTATTIAADHTTSVVSSLMKNAVHGLVPPLASLIDDHFVETGSARAYLADLVRGMRAGASAAAVSSRYRNLDAADAVERAFDAAEQQEFSVAFRHLQTAAGHDPLNPLVFGWQSRVARLMQRHEEAVRAADQSMRLLTAETPEPDRLVVEGIAREARRDFETAEARYRELVSRFADEPAWLMELGGFLERRARFAEAVGSYRDAVKIDSRLVRAHLELCRLYGPTRLNEAASATEQGQQALTMYRALGSRAGEAQVLLCLADVLKDGGDAERQEAERSAEAALRIFQELRSDYNAARAHHYLALTARRQGRLADAARQWELSLAGARESGNGGLEAAVLINLGVAQEALGNRSRALDLYQQSYALNERLSDNQLAAYSQANAGALRIVYGPDPEQGLRDIQNALAVVRRLGDKNFEVFCLQMISAYHRHRGRHEEADREANRALAIARERDLDNDVAGLTVDLAESLLARGNYGAAHAALTRVIEDRSEASPKALIRRAEVNIGLAAFDAAQRDLAEAATEIERRGDTGLRALLLATQGQLAFESSRDAEARTHFAAASRASADTLPDPAAVTSRIFLGLLDALAGRSRAGRQALEESLDHARRIGYIGLEARSRVYLARIAVSERRFADALAVLREIGGGAADSIGPDLQGQVHYWRSRALAGTGDAARRDAELVQARQIVERLRASLPEDRRAAFVARREVQPIFE